MKIRRVGTELFHADQQTHNEDSSPHPPNFANTRRSVHIRLRGILSVGQLTMYLGRQ